jgi:hypothetical protein
MSVCRSSPCYVSGPLKAASAKCTYVEAESHPTPEASRFSGNQLCFLSYMPSDNLRLGKFAPGPPLCGRSSIGSTAVRSQSGHRRLSIIRDPQCLFPAYHAGGAPALPFCCAAYWELYAHSRISLFYPCFHSVQKSWPPHSPEARWSVFLHCSCVACGRLTAPPFLNCIAKTAESFRVPVAYRPVRRNSVAIRITRRDACGAF